jgi:RND family efflux transporter MFP subunit
MKTPLLVAMLVFTLSACSKAVLPPSQAERPALTQVVGEFTGEGSHVYSGEIRARHEIALSFRVGGKITQRLVDVGAVVKAGQVLARLDSTDERLQMGSADAQYQLAQAEVERYRVLRSKNFISQSTLDAKEATLKSLSAQAGLARNQSSYTTLISEKSGVVMATLAEVGQVVDTGQTVISLAQDGEREVSIAIPESQFANLKIGMKAEVSLWSEGSENYHQEGRLRELSPAADAASRTYAARVSLPVGKVPLGMTAQVRFPEMRGGDDNSVGGEWIVPMTALFQQGNKAAVWIVAADHSVSLRTVQVISYRDDGVVIQGGLVKGERIVIAGVHMLHTGEKVHVIESGSSI